MARVVTRYLKLTPTPESRLSFKDAKEFIDHLSEISTGSFKLIIKSKAKSGIELFIGISSKDLTSFKKYIYSVLPSLIVSEVKKLEVDIINPSDQLNYRFKRHYAYPLYNQDEPETDSLSKLMNCISQIATREQIKIELTSTPSKPLKAKLLRRRLLSGYTPKLNNPGLIGAITKALFAVVSLVVLIVKTLLYVIQNLVYSKASKTHLPIKTNKLTNYRSVMLLDKLYAPLFRTRLTISVKASSKKQAESLVKDTEIALNIFVEDSGYQRFIASRNPRRPDIYSSSDLAAFYHFNKADLLTGIYQLDHLKKLATPNELSEPKQAGDVSLGINDYLGKSSELVLKQSARHRHLYITGATGSGKSTLLSNLICQDIASGQGLSLIDPHGDLAKEVIERIPKHRLNDLIYFDPSDLNQSYGINLLEIKAKPGTNEYLMEADLVTESVISLFRKIFVNEDNVGHRIEYILRNTIHTAFTIDNSSIFTIFRLLTDSSYRLKIVSNLENQDLANFWRNELGRAGEYQRVKMAAGITSKIGRFLFSEPARRVFSVSRTNLDINSLMNERKILICDFAKGKLGEDGSKLFSTAMLTKLQLAALSRVNLLPENRADHFLYVDEFQNYAPSVLVQMLSEARKYGLYLTMAEQSPSQQDATSTSIILANVGNLLCFRTASPNDAHILLHSFKQYLDDQDLSNLPPYNFYFKTTGKEVITPTSGRTLPSPKMDSNVSKDLEVKSLKTAKPEYSPLLTRAY